MPKEECGGLVVRLGAQIEGPPAFGPRRMARNAGTLPRTVPYACFSDCESNWERSLHTECEQERLLYQTTMCARFSVNATRPVAVTQNKAVTSCRLEF